MPICPKCRTGYDGEANCPECGSHKPANVHPKTAFSVSSTRCSTFGVISIFSAWIGSIVILGLFLIASFKETSTVAEGLLVALQVILHLGASYALWMALKYATDREQ
jgi:hypothetical protein